LFKLCAPPRDYTPMNSYQYSEERLKIIDGRRHRIIHENAAGGPLPTLADDLEYLRKTAWFLLGLVNQKYGFQLDMRKYFNLQSATAQEVIPEPQTSFLDSHPAFESQERALRTTDASGMTSGQDTYRPGAAGPITTSDNL